MLRISKTASPDPLTPGSPLQYTIVYTNIGNAAAQNVIITETYPPSATFFNDVTITNDASYMYRIQVLDTTGESSDFDAFLYLLQGGMELDRNHDSYGHNSQITRFLEPGTYTVRVSSFIRPGVNAASQLSLA